MTDFIQHPITKIVLAVAAIPVVWKVATWVATNAIQDAVEDTVNGKIDRLAERIETRFDTVDRRLTRVERTVNGVREDEAEQRERLAVLEAEDE